MPVYHQLHLAQVADGLRIARNLQTNANGNGNRLELNLGRGGSFSCRSKEQAVKASALALSLALSLAPSLCLAQQPKGDTSPASQAFNGINSRMHQGMDIEFTGNVDADYARAMTSVHQGAIDMAKTAIAFGKDPELRKLAETTIRNEEAALSALQTWISRQPK